MSSSTTSQTPSSPVSDSMPSTTISEVPSSTVSNAPASTSSQTPSSSSSASFSTRWDVFLSFRGEDTRLNFTGHLYQRLHDHGISTFKDDPELRRGEVISDALLDAIRNSKTYIVVLSKNYASSTWCLDELAEILNCHKTMHRLVIPVFYNIEPSIVRHQTLSFQQAFKKHQNRYRDEREKVNNWRFTLAEVANFSGHHISEDRSESDVINEIVDELLLKINPKTLDVAKYPVGLHSRVEAIATLLSSDTKGVIKFGIYGMGGVGKTTLAKALYNKLLDGGSFKGSCFLANVKEASGTYKGLESLQQQLINDVLRCTTKVEVQNVDQGIKLIEARICSTKVVVVVDDLDNLNHFQLLVGPFACGSVVIITTKDEEILDKAQVETSYQYLVNTLDDADSLALFTRHAFGIAEPISDSLMELSKDILRLAAGLPLALEIFGSHLFNKSEVGWKYFIEKLQRIPDSNIQQRLEISLDALESDDPVLKKVFLDIACFFIGQKKQEVVHIMESYYSFADHFIDLLKKRCLLTINDGWLGMHDLLQDVGKEIVRNSSPDEPGKRSRLWVSKDIRDVLENQNGTEAIECIICRYGECALDGVTLSADTFKRMRKLRFLKLEKVNLTGSLQQKFEDLRWLYWKHCPLECLPSEFYPQKLAILDLTCSNMRTMWELNMVPHVFEKLKTLNMSRSRDLVTTPDFMKLPSLETLNLELCESLEEVHMSIGSLVRLDSLNLKGCKKLRSLPDTICNLRALKVLNISECNSLKALPIQLGNIESLTKLNADSLTVSNLPDSIGHLTKLIKLNLRNNKKLETLPDTIGNLRSLESLDIDDCSSLEALPLQLGNIKSLTELNADRLSISKLPDSTGHLTKLVKLSLNNNKNLKCLPNTICNLRALERLSINRCTNVEALPVEFGNIESLKMLGAWYLSVSKLPDSIGSLTKLVELDLSYSKNLETLPDTICNLRSLEILTISECLKLETLPDQLWKITCLRKLDAVHANMLTKLPDIGSSESTLSLQELDLSLSRIAALPSGLSQLSNLQSLGLGFCYYLHSIPILPPSLKHLDADGCCSLERLPNLSNSKHLEKLKLALCKGLTYIQGLEDLISIRMLDLGGGSGLTNMHLTKRLFKVFSEFGHQINVYVPKFMDQKSCHQWSDWILESPYWTSEYSESQGHAYLLPNESHNFIGIILCFKRHPRDYQNTFGYSVRNTTSGFIWRSDHIESAHYNGTLMVIVPKAIFLVRDEDHRIEFTAHGNVKIVGIHLLYNPGTEILEDVAEKHLIDIDALKLIDPELHDIFLDIACFFIGWENNEVVQILETYYTNVHHNIDILKKTCLLNINDQDKLEMDDLHQYLGRKIAHNNSLEEPEKHSRLWISVDICDVLKKHKGTEVTEGIVPRKVYTPDIIKPYYDDIDDALAGESFTLETFKKMRKLRFLYLRKVHLTGSFEQAFEDLRWLRWDWCPLKRVPSEFCPPKLVILELRHSSIITMRGMVPHVFEKLKTLDMSGSEDLIITPDFTKLPCLETLHLEGCKSLEEVHISIGSLASLVSLNLHGCVNLRSLPDTICNLRALQVLDIRDCSCLEELPTTLGNIQSLREIKG